MPGELLNSYTFNSDLKRVTCWCRKPTLSGDPEDKYSWPT